MLAAHQVSSHAMLALNTIAHQHSFYFVLGGTSFPRHPLQRGGLQDEGVPHGREGWSETHPEGCERGGGIRADSGNHRLKRSREDVAPRRARRKGVLALAEKGLKRYSGESEVEDRGWFCLLTKTVGRKQQLPTKTWTVAGRFPHFSPLFPLFCPCFTLPSSPTLLVCPDIGGYERGGNHRGRDGKRQAFVQVVLPRECRLRSSGRPPLERPHRYSPNHTRRMKLAR